MKKIYFFAILGVLALQPCSLYSQITNDVEEISAIEEASTEELVKSPHKADAAIRPNAVFYIPNGALFSSYDFGRGWYRQIDPILHMPPFVDQTFKNATSGAESYEWKYVDPSVEYNMFNPQITSTQVDLTVNYGPQIGNIEAPTLKATNAQGDSISPQIKWLRVGGGPVHMETVSTTAHYYMGNSPADTKSTSNRNGGINYFAVNTPAANKTWTNRTREVNDTVMIKGVAELFYKPIAPYALREVHVPIYLTATQSVSSDFKLTLQEVEQDLTTGAIVSYGDTIATQVLSKDKMRLLSQSSGNKYYELAFKQLVDAKTNQVVEGFTIDKALLITLTLDNPDDETSSFTINMMCDKLQLPNKFHAYVLYDAKKKKDGTIAKHIYERGIFSLTSGYTRSLPFLLEASFEYLRGTETGSETEGAWEAPATGGTKTIDLISSVPYQDALKMQTFWKVTLEDGSPLPTWLNVTVTDEYNDEKAYQNNTSVKFQAIGTNNNDVREATVLLSFIGGKYKFNVKQKTTNSIQIITNDDSQADAPMYNIAGQRIDGNYKGVVIRNGKKIIR